MSRLLFMLLIASVLQGCTNAIQIDQVHGRTISPQGRISVLEQDLPGTASIGVSGALLKPANLRWRERGLEPFATGERSWEQPRWNFSTNLAWTPWEGITLAPSATIGRLESGWLGASTLGLGLHAGLERLAWQIEARSGVAWSRSTTTHRTLVTDVTSTSGSYRDSLLTDPLSGLSLTGRLGLQFETRFPRQPVQLWMLMRWGVSDPMVLTDRKNDAMAITMTHEWTGGIGVHRRILRANTLTAGVLASYSSSNLPPSGGAGSTVLIAQWETRFGKERRHEP